MKLKNSLLVMFAAGVLSAQAEVVRPTGFSDGQVRWQEQGNRSDDFESGNLDLAKWDNAPASLVVGAWTFAQPNAYVKNGNLVIETTQETHTRTFADSCHDGVAGGSSVNTQRQLFYKSGAVRTKADGVYGFYEAKIKGVEIFPGLSPAFWLYSDGHPFDDRNDTSKQYVDYSEIDIVELQQADWRSPTDFDDQFDMDHNLHARVEENGQIVWKRPKPNPEAQLLHYEAPFDPGKGFHTYAVENRPDKITWYVDGVEIGSKPNKWWHRPMHLIFSQGLRRHLIKYNAACQRADPNPDNVISEGFPEQARMEVQYVKTWKAMPSVWIEQPQQYQSTQYASGSQMAVTVNYHGGSEFYVAPGQFNGVTVNLVERNANGFVRTVATGNDPSTTNDDKKYAGETTVNLNLSGVPASNSLPQGHYYALAAAFVSSNGSNIYTQSPVSNITVTGSGSSSVAVSGVSASPSTLALTAGQSSQLNVSVAPVNASNKSVYYYSDDDSVAQISQSGVVTAISQGTTQVSVTTNDGGYSDSVTISVSGNNNGSGVSGNLLPNGDFETGSLASWNAGWGNNSISTDSHEGQFAGSTSGTGGLNQVVDVQPNTEYVLKGFVKVQQSGDVARMLVKDYGGSTKTVTFNSANYQEKSITFTTGASNTSVKVALNSNDDPGQVHYDGLTLSAVGSSQPVEPTEPTEPEPTDSEPTDPPSESCGTSFVAVDSVSLSASSSTLTVGSTLQLSANVMPSCATNKSVVYSTSDSSVLTVNAAGQVSARKKGSATITVKTKNLGKVDTLTLTVN